MKLETAKKLVDIINEEGGEASVYENYSGRFMYGEKTAGIVCEGVYSLMSAAYLLGHDDGVADTDSYDVSEELGSLCSDNMGRDMIYY